MLTLWRIIDNPNLEFVVGVSRPPPAHSLSLARPTVGVSTRPVVSPRDLVQGTALSRLLARSLGLAHVRMDGVTPVPARVLVAAHEGGHVVPPS